MKYTPIGCHGNSMLESHTHKASGPMDILITYSRHTTPRNFPTQDWILPQYVQPRYVPSSHNAQIRRQITPLSTQGRTTLLAHINTREVKTDDKGPGIIQSPQSPQQHPVIEGQLLTGLMRPTLAPSSLQAVAVHKYKPVTAQTIIKGQRLYPHTLGNRHLS